jgi:hypothetical protein
MTNRSDPEDRELLAPEDAALVRRVADALEPPAMTAARRARFDAALDARLARERWRFAPWLAAAAVAGAAALLLVARLPAEPPSEAPALAADAVAEDEFVLALGGESLDDFDASLPAEYQAIASLLASQ